MTQYSRWGVVASNLTLNWTRKGSQVTVTVISQAGSHLQVTVAQAILGNIAQNIMITQS